MEKNIEETSTTAEGETVVVHADPEGKTLAEREAEYETFVWANLKRNYIAHYLHGMLGMTGFRLVNAPTFLPAYLFAISGLSFIVGLGLALQQVGGVLSPIFGATQIEHRKRVMPAAVWMGGLARVQIVGMALAGWFLSGQPLIVAILSFMFLFGLFMGTQRVVFSILMAKVIPISRRGRLQAWRNATGGLIAAGLAWVAGKYFVEADLFGNGYATTFMFAAILTSLGLWALQFLMIEPEPPTTRAQTPFRERLKDFPRLISQDRGFMFFMIVQMLAITGRMATPFYILYAASTIELTGANIGLLSLAFLGADTLANLAWGYLGDKTGFRLVLISSLVVWISATVLLMNVHEVAAIFVAFFGLGAAQSGYMMSAQTMILEFGSRDDLPMRIAFSSTAEGIMASAGPLVGGVMAAALGYESVFGTSIAFLAAGLTMLLLFVREPRTTRAAG
ncbi:MFS transporter [Phenylobacterium sp.]|uniref:MFS transporter n=1 Tax=Phenylobacterium sp. TaxID=1871053 RepID=UPI0025E37EB9|nr:MFS transporter [Phenylobacterium sp.]